MRWTIARKLFVTLVLTSAMTLLLSASLGQWRFQRDFLAYKAAQDSQLLDVVAQNFGAYYTPLGNWDAVQRDSQQWRVLVFDSLPNRPRSNVNAQPELNARRGEQRPPPQGPLGRPPPRSEQGWRPPGPGGRPRNRPPPVDPLNLAGRLGLYDAVGQAVAGTQIDVGVGASSLILSGNEPVGELRLAPSNVLTEELDLGFAAGQRRSLMMIALAVLLLATLASWVLAPQLTQPIKRLANRARKMTAGGYEQRLAVAGSGELTDLAIDMNELASTLEKNRQSRQQWIADISHELRTPLAILTAELQALEDGIRQYSDDTRASLQLEVQRLTRLVQDLYELSAADEGRLTVIREPIDLVAILKQSMAANRTRIEEHELRLTLTLSPQPIIVDADAVRLDQLFCNLVENSLRYTDSPGALKVGIARVESGVEVVFEDSAPGVPTQSIGRVFERLYRLEPSRGRHSGGSGLGLAICKAIAQAHDGRIAAEPSALGGLRIRVTLPVLSAD